MIELREFEDIIQIRMSREFDGKPLFWVAAYLVDGLLIDTGCTYTAEELAGFLEKHPPEVAVNTHFHEDHVGANHLIQQRFGAEILAHPDSVPLISQKPFLYPYQQLVWGYPEPTRVVPIPEIIRTKRFSFEVIETPGHSVGHVALFERSRGWCFTGDMYPGRAIRTIRPEENIHAIVSSLKRVQDLGAGRLVLLTSIGRIIEKGHEALDDFFSYISDLERKAIDLQKEGASVEEIISGLFGGEDPRSLNTNGQYTTENLIRSILKMDPPHRPGA